MVWGRDAAAAFVSICRSGPLLTQIAYTSALLFKEKAVKVPAGPRQGLLSMPSM